MVTASNVLPNGTNIIQSSNSLKERAVTVINKLINLASHI